MREVGRWHTPLNTDDVLTVFCYDTDTGRTVLAFGTRYTASEADALARQPRIVARLGSRLVQRRLTSAEIDSLCANLSRAAVAAGGTEVVPA